MPAPLDDHGLVAAAQGGDRDALDRLLRRHYDRIHAVCRRITGNESDANDAAQEALIAVVRGLPRFDGRASFATWVYRIATNASLDELRRRRRRPVPSGADSRPDGHGSGPDGSGPHTDIADRHPDLNADTPADRLADRLAIEAALRTLPDEFRVPVVLRDIADLDYAEIAEVLDVPIGTVKSRIARGRGQLATALARTDLYPSGNHDDPSERPTRTTGQSPR